MMQPIHTSHPLKIISACFYDTLLNPAALRVVIHLVGTRLTTNYRGYKR
jgi:hypothetical protein